MASVPIAAKLVSERFSQKSCDFANGFDNVNLGCSLSVRPGEQWKLFEWDVRELVPQEVKLL